MAEVLSVSSQSVSKWENHLSVPDISLLPIIARYFGITMDELFNYRLDALNYRERFIRFMADNGVLQFGEFQLQRGRISPYFINTGNYKSANPEICYMVGDNPVADILGAKEVGMRTILVHSARGPSQDADHNCRSLTEIMEIIK